MEAVVVSSGGDGVAVWRAADVESIENGLVLEYFGQFAFHGFI